MNASCSPWTLSDADARLNLGVLSGQVDFRRPFSGLQATCVGAKLRLFGVELPPSAGDESPECYVRGCDLVCTYLEHNHPKIRGQIYWRAFEWGAARAVGIDLIVSVQTSLLASDPTLKVRSTVSANEVLEVKDFEHATTTEITPRGGDFSTPPARGREQGCWLFRLVAQEWTYIEMVHPLDFVSSVVRETARGEVEHATQLFRGPLEKGVILRSRLRGVVAPRSGDVQAAIACYREFAASEPPLTV